jgi:hypothetical protein
MEDINLNSFVYNDKITKEDIFSCVSQEEIYALYIGESVGHGYVIRSPLRNDNSPSFATYYHRSDNKTLMFKDFATGHSGDVVVFVCLLYGLKYREALWKIAYDFKLLNVEITAERKAITQAKKRVNKEPIKLGIKIRDWDRRDADFWRSFGIKKATLQKYDVVPISHLFFNGNASKVQKFAYAYIEYKDEQVSYKIYQPYNKRFKWINNANSTVHQGYRQLPSEGETLIITKSLKDVMSLRDVMRIPSIGLQSESITVKDSVMDEYKFRFKRVVCLFDNDAAGEKLSQEFSDKYGIPYFFMPKIKGVSDFSDLVKVQGKEEARKTFNKIFNEIRW